MFGPDSDDAIYVKEADDTTFVNLQLMLDVILPWGASIDTDKSEYAGSIPARAAITLPQDSDSNGAGE
jgi:hypothetical protein